MARLDEYRKQQRRPGPKTAAPTREMLRRQRFQTSGPGPDHLTGSPAPGLAASTVQEQSRRPVYESSAGGMAGPGTRGTPPSFDLRIPQERTSLSEMMTTGGGMSDYEQQYRDAMSQTGAGIERQFRMAMEDIAQRERAAGEALGLLPGQVNELYDQGNAGLANAISSLDSAQAASGLNSFMGAEPMMAPLQTAMGMDRTARLADVPLLQLAQQTEFARQRGGLGNARLEAEQQMQAEERQFLRDMMDRDYERQLLNERWSREDAMRDEDWQRELSLYGIQQEAEEASGPDPLGSGLSRAEADTIRQSPAYRYAINSSLGEGISRDGENVQLTAEEVINKYANDPLLQRVLIADLLGGPAQAADLMGL